MQLATCNQKTSMAWLKLQAICTCLGKHEWSKMGNASCDMLGKQENSTWCVYQLGTVLFKLSEQLSTASSTYRRRWMLLLGNLPVTEMFLTDGGVSKTNYTNKFITSRISPVWWLHHLHVALALLPHRRRLIDHGHETNHPALYPACTANVMYGIHPVCLTFVVHFYFFLFYFYLMYRMGVANEQWTNRSCFKLYIRSLSRRTRRVNRLFWPGGISLAHRSFAYFFVLVFSLWDE